MSQTQLRYLNGTKNYLIAAWITPFVAFLGLAALYLLKDSTYIVYYAAINAVVAVVCFSYSRAINDLRNILQRAGREQVTPFIIQVYISLIGMLMSLGFFIAFLIPLFEKTSSAPGFISLGGAFIVFMLFSALFVSHLRLKFRGDWEKDCDIWRKNEKAKELEKEAAKDKVKLVAARKILNILSTHCINVVGTESDASNRDEVYFNAGMETDDLSEITEIISYFQVKSKLYQKHIAE